MQGEYISNIIMMDDGTDLSIYPNRILLPDGKGIGDKAYSDSDTHESLYKEIATNKLLLTNTDYIVLKIAEAMADGDNYEVDQLKTLYANELYQRKKARERINELEEVVKNK